MNNELIIPVTFKGKELEFPARLLNYGYTSKLEVEIEGTKVYFERDDESNWRALISYEDLQTNKKLNPDLLKEIITVLEQVTKS